MTRAMLRERELVQRRAVYRDALKSDVNELLTAIDAELCGVGAETESPRLRALRKRIAELAAEFDAAHAERAS